MTAFFKLQFTEGTVRSTISGSSEYGTSQSRWFEQRSLTTSKNAPNISVTTSSAETSSDQRGDKSLTTHHGNNLSTATTGTFSSSTHEDLRSIFGTTRPIAYAEGTSTHQNEQSTSRIETSPTLREEQSHVASSTIVATGASAVVGTVFTKCVFCATIIYPW